MGKGKCGQRAARAALFTADFIGAIFGLSMTIRRKVCLWEIDEAVAALRRGARPSASGLSHDKAATPTRKTSDIHHSERPCWKSERAAHEVIEQAFAVSRK